MKKHIYSYLKCILYDKLLKPQQSFWIALYMGPIIGVTQQRMQTGGGGGYASTLSIFSTYQYVFGYWVDVWQIKKWAESRGKGYMYIAGRFKPIFSPHSNL